MNRHLLDYFNSLDRAFFIDPPYNGYAYIDKPLPIGYGQTISQPSLVLMMTEKLDLNSNCSVLEIGTGSGYQTALLAKFSKEVYTVEIIEALSVAAQSRLHRLGFTNIHFKIGDGSAGWPEYAPFDRIILTAAPSRMPLDIMRQLKFNGKMILPVGPRGYQQLLLVTRDGTGSFNNSFITAVAFVDLIGKYCDINA